MSRLDETSSPHRYAVMRLGCGQLRYYLLFLVHDYWRFTRCAYHPTQLNRHLDRSYRWLCASVKIHLCFCWLYTRFQRSPQLCRVKIEWAYDERIGAWLRGTYTHVSLYSCIFRRELEPRDGISVDNRAHVDTASPSSYAATMTIHGRIHGRILVLFYGAPAV